MIIGTTKIEADVSVYPCTVVITSRHGSELRLLMGDGQALCRRHPHCGASEARSDQRRYEAQYRRDNS